MFRNARRGGSGLGALIAVAVLIAAYLTTAGLMWREYRGGGEAAKAGCQVVCGSTSAARPANG